MRKALIFMCILNDSDVNWLAAHGTRQFVETGTTLITQGVAIDALYILLEGKLSVVSRSDRLLAMLHSGEVLGEISFVDSRTPSASVRADQDSTVLCITREALNRKMARDIGFSARFYHAIALYLADRLRVTTSRLGFGDTVRDQTEDLEELDGSLLDNVSLGATRFAELMRRINTNEIDVVHLVTVSKTT